MPSPEAPPRPGGGSRGRNSARSWLAPEAGGRGIAARRLRVAHEAPARGARAFWCGSRQVACIGALKRAAVAVGTRRLQQPRGCEAECQAPEGNGPGVAQSEILDVVQEPVALGCANPTRTGWSPARPGRPRARRADADCRRRRPRADQGGRAVLACLGPPALRRSPPTQPPREAARTGARTRPPGLLASAR